MSADLPFASEDLSEVEDCVDPDSSSEESESVLAGASVAAGLDVPVVVRFDRVIVAGDVCAAEADDADLVAGNTAGAGDAVVDTAAV